ncbi:hypothetical protein GCM10023263_10880 [Phytohabitans rumicis]
MQDRFPGEAPERYAPPAAYRPEGTDRANRAGDLPNEPRNGSALDLGGLTEPVFPPAAWLDTAPGSLADHPLLRGLLLELPPKGAVPPPGWLDRWFEAARSILELLYGHDSGRPR